MVDFLIKINPVLVSLGSLVMIISYVPQLLTTFRLKSSKGQSKAFWGMLTFTLFTFVINGLVVAFTGGGIATLVPQLFNFIFAGMMLVMVVIYPDK